MPKVFGFGDDCDVGPYVEEGCAGIAVPISDSVEIAIHSGSETRHHIWQSGKILLIKPGTGIRRSHKKKCQNASMESRGQSEKDPGTSEQEESRKELLVVYFTMIKLEKP
jgi:hypothetical protein